MSKLGSSLSLSSSTAPLMFKISALHGRSEAAKAGTELSFFSKYSSVSFTVCSFNAGEL